MKESSAAQKTFNLILYCTILFVPIFFLPQTFLVFELPKVVLFRICTILLGISALWILIKEKSFQIPILKDKKLPVFSISIWLLFMFVSTITSVSPFISFFGEYHKLHGLLTWLHIMLWLILIIIFVEKKSFIRIQKTIILGSTLVSLYAFLQKLNLDPISNWQNDALLGRVFSTLGQPNYLGSYLIITIPITFAYIFSQKKEILYLSFTSLLLQLLALAFTLSRGAWLGLIIGTIFTFLIKKGLKSKKTLNRITIASLSGISFLFIINLVNKFIQLTNLPIINRLILNTENLRSFESRVYIWQSALETIKASPWFGNGLETFFMTFTKYQSKELLGLEIFTETADRAHNHILDMATNIGILGTFAYYFFLISLLYQAIKYLRKEPNQNISVFIYGLICSIISIETAHLFGFYMITHYLLFWLLIGLLINMIYEKKVLLIKQENSKIMLSSGLVLLSVWLIFSLNIKTIAADIVFKKGSYLIENGESNQASSLYEKSIQINSIPHFYQMHLINAYSLLWKYQNDLTTLEKSEKLAQEIAKKAPQDFNVYLLTGRIKHKLAELGQIPAVEVFDVYQKGLLIAPYNPQLHIEYAKTAFDLQNFSKAIEIYEKLVSFTPEYLQKKNLSLEEKEKKRIFIKLTPQFEQVFLHLARSYAQIGQFENALKYLQYTPENVDSFSTYATIYSLTGDLEKALEYTKKGLEIEPENSTLKKNLEILENSISK